MLKSSLIAVVLNLSQALRLKSKDVCSKFTEHHGILNVWNDNEVIENLIITQDPTDDSKANDYALRITGDNVTIRNVIIYHAANAMGIFAWKANNLTIENVQIFAYGNEWGANPCPTRSPFNGIDCSNIKIYHSDNVLIENALVENGSRGISCVNCPDSTFRRIVAKNPRGPYAGG